MQCIKKILWPQVALGVGMLAVLSCHAEAGELVYRPVNPAFGGNPANYSWLLESANVQNEYKDTDPLETFDADLKKRILNMLATKIVNSAFGSYNDGLTSGQYQFGDYNITISTEGGGITVDILDQSTGGSSNISVPYY